MAEGVPGDVALPVEDYAYDEEGNRTASHLSALYASNAHNQLLEDEDYTYAYDARGNRVSRTAKADGAVETYTYDSQNRLVGYASSTTTASYVYDAMDRRIGKIVNGEVEVFVYDTSMVKPLAHDDILLEFVNGDLARQWQHSGFTDEPLGFASQATYYEVYADRLGSITNVIDVTTGAIVAKYEYSAFGTRAPTVESLFQRYGYSGREVDAESGAIYFRARYFDPVTGQFISSDRLGFGSGTANLYAYVSNNPFNYIDPTGETAATAGPLRNTSTGSIEYAMIDNTEAGIRAAVADTILKGLVRGTLNQLVTELDNIVFMATPDDGRKSERSGDDDTCKPGPSKWQQTKRAFIAVLEIFVGSQNVQDNIQTIRPDIGDLPTKTIEQRNRDMKKYQDEVERLRDLYENGNDPDDGC